MIVISISRVYRYRSCFLFMLFLPVGLLSPSAYADGGAPQLAYVAGAAQGISIIDIARRHVTGTIAVSGNPRTVLLSLDGTVLYAAGQGDTSVRALDPATCAAQQIFETHEPVYGMAVTASTAANATPSTPNQLWITGTTSLTIFEVNGHPLGSVSIAGRPQNICIPGGFTAYVSTRQGTVVAVDMNTRQVVRTLLSAGQFGSMDYNASTGE